MALVWPGVARRLKDIRDTAVLEEGGIVGCRGVEVYGTSARKLCGSYCAVLRGPPWVIRTPEPFGMCDVVL
jgi:hypothetical protein